MKHGDTTTGHDAGASAGARMPQHHASRRTWVAAIAATAIIALLVSAVLRPADTTVLTAPNRPAPEFTMSLYGGGTLDLSTLRGKTVVLNFWWSQCVPCLQEAALLERQWRVWRSRGVIFVGVNELDDPASQAPRLYLHRFGITYPNGWDPGDVDIQFGTSGQPETFFITPRGGIRLRYAGPIPNEGTLTRLIGQASS